MVRFDLICQQMQQFFFQFSLVLADVQVIVFVRLKAGYYSAILKYVHFTAFAVVVQVFTNLKMMNLFIYSDTDRVIFHLLAITIRIKCSFNFLLILFLFYPTNKLTIKLLYQQPKHTTMQEEETFEIAVKINEGLEPLTFTIIAQDDISTPEHVFSFKVTRDKHTLATIRPDADHCWQLLKGEMEKEDVDAIGSAIDAHYA